MGKLPYGAAAMQDVTDEMSAGKLTCITGGKLVEPCAMDDVKGRTLVTESKTEIEALA